MNSEMFDSVINFEPLAPEGHPVRTLMEEHKAFLKLAVRLADVSAELEASGDDQNIDEHVRSIQTAIDQIKDTQNHYLREENVLFAFLQKHGITGPPSIMWAEHDQIRECKKSLYAIVDNASSDSFRENASKLAALTETFTELLLLHFNKENIILFPMAMSSFSDAEWQATTQQFAEIGYPAFMTADSVESTPVADEISEEADEGGMIKIGVGQFSNEELTAMLNSLPLDITFVDKDDTFRYFNQVKDPIFTRTEASIGLKVQNCHPAKSVHLVNKIIADFKAGIKDEVAFWIDFNEKYVYIRYFAVRNAEGKFLGCMEVTQDIKDIQTISGEKRLLDN